VSAAIAEQYRVKIALMTANDPAVAKSAIEACWDLDLLDAAYKRARELNMTERAAEISYRFGRVRGS
jgi:DNA-binding transcriptional regulator PaaX